jgi:hypothetical protein
MTPRTGGMDPAQKAELASAPEALVNKVTILLSQNPLAVLEQGAYWRPGSWLTTGGLRAHETLIADIADQSDPGRTADERMIRRRHIFDIKDPVRLFLAAMIWGHGRSGYGPARVGKIVEVAGTELRPRIEGLITAAHRGPPEAWDALTTTHQLKFLGPAFATKVAYFAAFTPESSAAQVLIADANTSWAMWDLVDLARSVDRRDAYLSYVGLARCWADERGWRADDVEWALFEIGKEVARVDRSPEYRGLNRRLVSGGSDYQASSRYGGSNERAIVHATGPSSQIELTDSEEDLLRRSLGLSVVTT